MSLQNGICRIGFFNDDQPYGKYVEYELDGKPFKEMGIYDGEECVKPMFIESFEQNLTPKEVDSQ